MIFFSQKKKNIINSNSIFCPNCGNSIDDNSVFCKKCGFKLQSGSNNNLIVQNGTIEEKEPEQKKEYKKEYILPDINMLDNKELETIINLIKEKDDICIPIGKVENEYIIERIKKLPNLLVCGTVMSGKSNYIHTLLTSLLYTNKPDNLKLVIFDSKRLEYFQYNGIPHLLMPIINDEKKFKFELVRIIREIERRYDLLIESNTKDIDQFNINNDSIPTIIVIIDDYYPLSFDEETNSRIDYISKKGWNVNVHLILAINHPSANIISTISKNNFPSRLCFRVTSKNDSIVALDQTGAEKITGLGNALYCGRFNSDLINVIIPLVQENDIKDVAYCYIKQGKNDYDYLLQNDVVDKKQKDNDITLDEPLYNEIVDFVIEQGKVSISLLQRRFRLGYNRAARCIDLLEERGVVGPSNGNYYREVLMKEVDR